MNPITRRRIGLAAALAMAAGMAQAHPGHPVAGFIGGLAHPLALDHLLVALAVGAWSAAALAREKAWCGPAVFLGGLAVAAALGAFGIAMPFAEAGVASSVIVLGLMLALAFLARRAGTSGLAVIAAAALWHGSAHALEAPATALASYAAGFLLATGLLHVAGLAVSRAAQRLPAMLARQLALAAGGAMAGAGVWLLLQ